MKKIRTLIIDDERLARKELASLLADINSIELVGEASDVDSALIEIEKKEPQLLFLDIQMPKKTGFDLLKLIDPEIKVIFVTAYDEYAIRAFEVNAMDYLMKPVYPERLYKSIERLFSDDVSREKVNIKPIEYDDTLFINLNNKYEFIKPEKIIAISSAGDYSELFFVDIKKGLVLKSMKEWESRLPEKYFVRVHRSTIINLEHVNKLESWFNHSYKIYMNGIEEPFMISRRYVSKLKALLG